MATKTVVTTLLPYPDASYRFGLVGSSYGGGAGAGYIQSDASSTSESVLWLIGQFMPSQIGGNNVVINRITAYFYSTVSHTNADTYVGYQYNNAMRTGPNDGDTWVNGTLSGIGANTFKAEITPNHTIQGVDYVYQIHFYTSVVTTAVRLQGIQVEWTYTIPSSYPYTVYHCFANAPDYISYSDGAAQTYGFSVTRYYRPNASGQQLYWDMSKIIPSDVDGHSVTVNDVKLLWWHSTTKTGSLYFQSYDAERINTPSPSTSYSTSTSTFTLVLGSYTYEVKVSPNHTMVDGHAYFARFYGMTSFGSGPRIMGGHVKYTVNA